MLKARTKSTQQTIAEKRAYLDKLEEVLKEEQVTISQLDKKTRDLLQQAKEAHVTADARVSACAKLQEDLDHRAIAVS
jgi:flagellar biosynthesis/type III secretory pathway chaperone